MMLSKDGNNYGRVQGWRTWIEEIEFYQDEVLYFYKINHFDSLRKSMW